MSNFPESNPPDESARPSPGAGDRTPLPSAARRAAERLVAIALEEDLGERGDLTSAVIIPPELQGTVFIVARQPGVLAGMAIVDMVFAAVDSDVTVQPRLRDGDSLGPGTIVAEVSGPVASLLIGERTALNFLTHLCGIATLTRSYVTAVAGSGALILDTRKTFPGWRALQKHAVRSGGGTNHRMGLWDGVLIKDNHLAAWTAAGGEGTVAAAVRQARDRAPAGIPIEVEVDTLAQLDDALPARPDIVLLDNMSLDELREAVARRNAAAPGVRLEASGGVTLATVGDISRTGVDRISIGALTHSAAALDLGFDWSRVNARRDVRPL